MFARCKNAPVELLALAAVVLAALLAPAWFPSEGVLAQEPQAKPADHVSGVVINSVTREPIARALVISEGELFATMTDSSGRFEIVFPEAAPGGQTPTTLSRPVAPENFRRIAPRPHMLTARKPGFLNSQSQQGQLGEQVVDGKEVEIALVPEALIVGHISLPTSEPPDPIEVELYQRQVRSGRAHWVSVGIRSTRSDGEFRFAELSAGSYRLLTHERRDDDPKFAAPEGQAYGYPPVYYPNASGFSSAGSIALTPGKLAHANLKLARQPYFPVIVPVTNLPPGNRFGLDVSVQGTGGPGYELGYDRQKQSIVGLLPNGSYQLRVMSFGTEAFSGEANLTVHGGTEGTLLPLAATPAIRVNVKDQFTSEPDPVMTGTVGPHGKVISQQRRFDVTLMLEAVDDFRTQQQNASTAGSLDPQTNSMQIEHVAPGRYWVEVYPTDGYVASVTSGGVDLRHRPLVVPSGSSAPSIEVLLRNDQATVEGVVEGASSLTGSAAPIAVGPNGWNGPSSSDSSARLYFIPLPDSAGRFTERPVAHDGRFSVSLPPGDYRVLVFPQVQPDLEYENPEAMRAYDTKGQVVRLAAGQKEQLQLQLLSASE